MHTRVICTQVCSFKIEEFSVTVTYSFFADLKDNESANNFLNFKIDFLKFFIIQFIVSKLKDCCHSDVIRFILRNLRNGI